MFPQEDLFMQFFGIFHASV